MARHCAHDCCKRGVSCPFGCLVELQADQLAAHAQEAQPAHALQLLERLHASEVSAEAHDKRIFALENRLSSALALIDGAETRIAAVATGLAAITSNVTAHAVSKEDLRRSLEASSAKRARVDSDMQSDIAKNLKANNKLSLTVAKLEAAFVRFQNSGPRAPGRGEGS